MGSSRKHGRARREKGARCNVKEIRIYPVYPSNLDVPTAFAQVGEHLAESKYDELLGHCTSARFSVEVDEHRSIHSGSFAEFLRVLQQHPEAMPLTVHSHWQNKKREGIMCGITVEQSMLRVEIEASDLNTMAGLHDRVRELFHASVPQPDKSPTLSRYAVKKSAFVAHRFDDEGKVAAEALVRFVRRLGFDVVEGEGYEARGIPEKVADRIRSQDIFICLVTPGDHSWILSEASFAKALGKYVVVLCQQDVAFNKGIIGSDYEYLSFPNGIIEKAYCDLLYALPR